mgnify:FL=1
MIGQYRGKRLFSGRLFAGRLFGPVESAAPPAPGGGRMRYRLPRHLVDQQALRAIEEDDVLLLIAGALVAGSPVH